MTYQRYQFTKMLSKFSGRCCECNAEIAVAQKIYYCRAAGGAFCAGCGVIKFEPQVTDTPIIVSEEHHAPVQRTEIVVTVMPYTTTKDCYCKLVGSPCGWCVAQDELREDIKKAQELVGKDKIGYTITA